MIPYHRLCSLFIFLWIGLSQQTVSAMGMDLRSSYENDLDFAMWFSFNRTTLKDHSISTHINYRRIGVSAFDVTPNRPVQVGLFIGNAYTTQDDISATQGIDLNGYYLGLGARMPIIVSQQFTLRLDIDYIYQSVNGSTDTQKVSRDWNETAAGVLATVPIGYFELLGGMYYQRIDATQTATGTIQQTLLLDNDSTFQSRLGIDYSTAPGEHVGLHYHSGASSGIQIKFQKLF